jgi:hypothetical protein
MLPKRIPTPMSFSSSESLMAAGPDSRSGLGDHMAVFDGGSSIEGIEGQQAQLPAAVRRAHTAAAT